MGFLKDIRIALKLGSAQGALNRRRFKAALSKAASAEGMGLSGDSQWLYHSITGKALYHLGREADALDHLRLASQLLVDDVSADDGSDSELSVLRGIQWYIDKIENSSHNKSLNSTPQSGAS